MFVCLFGALVFSGCNKDAIQKKIIELSAVDGFQRYDLQEDVLVVNEYDSDDQRNNEKLLQWAKTLEPAVQNAEVRRQLLSLVQQSGKGFIRLQDALQIPEIQALFPAADLDGVDFPLPHLDDMHEAVINVPNIETADPAFNPLVSPGIEVEDDESIGRDDYIFSWYLTDEGTFAEVAVGEKQAMEMKNPLFVVTPHPVAGEENGRVVNVEPQEVSVEDESFDATAGVRNPEELVLDEYQVKNPYFFEKHGNLEWYLEVVMTYFNSPNFNIFNSYTYHTSVKRDDVKHSKIHDPDASLGTYISGTFTNPIGGGSDFFVISYERDWYASPKPQYCFCSCQQQTGDYVLNNIRMKYTYEYYTKECGIAQVQWPTVGSYLYDTSNKGMIKIIRID